MSSEFLEQEQSKIINEYTREIANIVREKKIMADIDLVKLNRINQVNLSTAFMHMQTFPKFKGIHQGKDVYLIASGVTASKFFHKKGKDDIYIGVNRSFQLGHELDYVFIQDFSGKTPEYIDELDLYRRDKCQKFYGLTVEWNNTPNRVIPESHAIKAKALRYRTDWAPIDGFSPQFAYDIATQPLACFGSIVFPALQFALWTYPKRIYLVGCDCTTNGYGYDKNDKNFLIPDKIIAAYKKFKDFAHKYYPDVEIISINPVGLKGIFKEV
jgi:hypothetical protein